MSDRESNLRVVFEPLGEGVTADQCPFTANTAERCVLFNGHPGPHAFDDMGPFSKSNPTRTYERGPLGLTLWSRSVTWAFSLRVWRWVLEYHPMTVRQPVVVTRRKVSIGSYLFLLRRWV